MKARKMKLVALGLAASMIMGLAAPAMADELSDGFGQEDVLDTESIQENTQENTAETAEGEEESSFKEQLKEDVLSSEEEQEEEIIAMVGAGEMTEGEADADKTALAQQLIDEAMDTSQDQGIAAAMDSALDALANNAGALSDSETGVLAVSGDEIIEMTTSAAQEHFEVSDRLAMGAMSTAAERAVDRGVVDALGGSRELVDLASSNYAGKEVVDELKNNTQLLFNGYIDTLCKTYPEFALFAPIMKNLFGKILGLGDGAEANPYALIMEELWVIENKLDNLQAHLDNRVLMNTFGNDFNDLTAAGISLRTKLNDYTLRYDDEAERNAAIAELYNSNEYSALMCALNKASNNFAGKTSNDLDQQSLFDVAYRSACGSVMFSGEAIDIMSVYMTRQIAYYMEAYGYINIVLDAYEYVYGANACRATRAQMFNRLGTRIGNDLAKDEQGVFGLLGNFLDRSSRTIFVNKSENTKVALSRDLAVVSCNVNVPWLLFNDCLKKTPEGIGKKELEAIAKYAVNTKKMSVLGFLTEVVGFRLTNPVDENSNGRNLMVCSQRIMNNLQFAPLEVALPLKNNKTSVDTVGTVWKNDVVVHFQSA